MPSLSSRQRITHPTGILRIAILVAMSMASLMSATVGAQSPSPDAQAGSSVFAFTAWQLAELTTNGNPAETPDASSTISLVFGEDDAVTVESACAAASGTIALNDDGGVVPNLSVPTGDTTSCERKSLEERFLNLVNLATAWTLEDDRLTLTLMDGGTIVLRQTIAGTTWQWLGFQGGDGTTVEPDSAEPITLVFGGDGMATLTTACRTATMPYTLEGTSGLSLDTSALSEVTCADGARLYADFGAMRSYVFRDGRLYVALMADAGIHEFVAVEAKG